MLWVFCCVVTCIVLSILSWWWRWQLSYAISSSHSSFFWIFVNNTNFSCNTQRCLGCVNRIIPFFQLIQYFFKPAEMDTSDPLISVLLSSRIQALLLIIGMVVSCCGNVLITSFWSRCRAHPCRSKLRNTYCTLDFAKDCFRISSWTS